MALQHVRADVGPIVLQVRESGADPTTPPRTVYTAGEWSFATGVENTWLMGPRGPAVTAIPFVNEQMISVTLQGGGGRELVGARLLGNNVFGAASAAADAKLMDSYVVGAGAKDRAGRVAALDALALGAAVEPSVYELRLAITDAGTAGSDDAEASGTLFRISPIPVAVTDQTDVFAAAPTAAMLGMFFEAGSGAIGDTMNVIFEVDAPTDGALEVDWLNPKVNLVSILCMSGREVGNSFVYVYTDSGVSADSTITMTRAGVPDVPANFRVLGANARLRVVDFTEALASVPGIA